MQSDRKNESRERERRKLERLRERERERDGEVKIGVREMLREGRERRNKNRGMEEPRPWETVATDPEI